MCPSLFNKNQGNVQMKQSIDLLWVDFNVVFVFYIIIQSLFSIWFFKQIKQGTLLIENYVVLANNKKELPHTETTLIDDLNIIKFFTTWMLKSDPKDTEIKYKWWIPTVLGLVLDRVSDFQSLF